MHQDQKSPTPMKFEAANAHHRYKDLDIRTVHKKICKKQMHIVTIDDILA